jgi:hypothetical protein
MLSAMMISTGANNIDMAHHHYTAMQDNSHGYHPPASAKIPQMQVTGNIHPPRQSFTKRSFGRDLMNVQQNHQYANNSESA